MIFKEHPTFSEVIGSIAFIGAMFVLAAVVVAPIVQGTLTADAANNMAIGAQAGLLAICAAGAGFYLRGKVASPGEGGSTALTVNAGERGTVNVDNVGAGTPPGAMPPAPAALIPNSRASYAPAVAPPSPLLNVGPVAATPVMHTSRGLQGQHVERGPVVALERELAEGGSDQRGGSGVV